MILIDKHVTDLVVGYDTIRKAEGGLPVKWQRLLQAAYTRRGNAYKAECAAHEKRAQQLKSMLPFGFGLAAILTSWRKSWFMIM